MSPCNDSNDPTSVTVNTDYMANGYDLIKEPLNLCRAGQKWFRETVRLKASPGPAIGLVLGASPWIVQLLRRTHRRVIVVDSSPDMLQKLTTVLSRGNTSQPQGFVDCVLGNWLALPEFVQETGVVVGDNSFSFLSFPEVWKALCQDLADRMPAEGRLIIRILSVPANHKVFKPEDILERCLKIAPINCTVARAMLLFSEWNRSTFAIDTEAALDRFEQYFDSFAPLVMAGGTTNDLLTMRKYRNSAAKYYAPPLEAILDVIREHFTITGVHFGPYVLSDYFPLVVAKRR